MKDIYLLIEHGMDQGEVYVLGWFDDEKRAKEVAEEKEAIAQYGTADSGASLGDILGAALKQRAGDKPEAETEKAEE